MGNDQLGLRRSSNAPGGKRELIIPSTVCCIDLGGGTRWCHELLATLGESCCKRGGEAAGGAPCCSWKPLTPLLAPTWSSWEDAAMGGWWQYCMWMGEVDDTSVCPKLCQKHASLLNCVLLALCGLNSAVRTLHYLWGGGNMAEAFRPAAQALISSK